MNNNQWYQHRADMHNYMPTMIAFKRKRSGCQKYLENVLVWIAILGYLAVMVATLIFTTITWHWNPVLIFIGFVVLAWKPADLIHKLVYADDSGIHNLEGYDPKTHTVPSLEAQGFDTKKFTTRLPKRRG
jgi:hypothetical protein